jgi:hypothetical protein
MISAQVPIVMLLATVKADVAISTKQRFVGQRRDNMGLGNNSTVAGDDAVDIDLTGLTVQTRVTSTYAQKRVADRPDNNLSRIQTDGFLPSHPVDGLTRQIQPQYPRQALELMNCR